MIHKNIIEGRIEKNLDVIELKSRAEKNYDDSIQIAKMKTIKLELEQRKFLSI